MPSSPAPSSRCRTSTNSTAESVVFDGANLERARFVGAKLKGTRFRAATLTYADFSNADLDGADFTGASMTRVRLHGASLKGTIGLEDRSGLIGTEPPLFVAQHYRPAATT